MQARFSSSSLNVFDWRWLCEEEWPSRISECRLQRDPVVSSLKRLDEDGQPDFEVSFGETATIRVECKNCSPVLYADGTPKVEVQKTRGSAKDPTSRF